MELVHRLLTVHGNCVTAERYCHANAHTTYVETMFPHVLKHAAQRGVVMGDQDWRWPNECV